jgi:prepilin-type N-terminal cleavage/methylation domain-containing protein/prepilin-type processing-associated H-X9-DG protein
MFSKTKSQSNFFTLIELLVVIAIIGILASMLLPALKRAKDSGKRISCANKFKNIGSALFMYSNDWNGYIPAGSPIFGSANASAYAWHIAIAPYVGKDWTMGVYPCNYAKREYFWCPSVPEPPAASQSPGISGIGLGRYVTTPTSVFWEDCYRTSQRLTNATNTSNKILVGDSPSYVFGGYWDFENPPAGAILSFHVRHLNGLNLLYADSHLDWMSKNTISEKVANRTLFPD